MSKDETYLQSLWKIDCTNMNWFLGEMKAIDI